jgi:mannan polymerase II complex MNN11 subunit
MNQKRLESLMIRDQSIVPPDSVIKTFPHLKGNQIDMVITQDKEGLAQGSFIIRKGDWSRFFLDTWFDPLYRSYNFQKADTHALVSLNPSRFVTSAHELLGTYCSMASNNSLQTRACTATDNECISKGAGGGRIRGLQRWRLHNSACRM